MIINNSKYNKDWQTKTLNELGTFNRGKSKHRPRNDKALFENGKYPLIQTGEIKDANLYITSHINTYNDFGLKQSKLWPKNTLCITIAANIAETALLNYPMCFPDSVVGFNAFENESSELFMHYVFTYIKSTIQNAASGSIQDNINIDFLTNLNFKIPKKESQDIIAKVLSDLDAKIELNNKINIELEAMAKTLYDYWFVQFDFPNSPPSEGCPQNGVGIGKPYKSSGGKMVYNAELRREIPEGWTADVLGSWIANDKSGDWGKEIIEGNYTEKVHCIRGADLNGLNGNGVVKAPTRYILEKNSHKMLDPHDLIVEISGGSPTQSTGRMAYITKETLERFDAPLICSNFCKAVTLEDEMYLFNFALQWDKAYDHGVLFGYEGKTSGIKNLLFESFVSSYFVAKPPKELAEKFYNFMEPIQSKKQKNLRENQQLWSLRDWLLPMLMNGQVSVGDVEMS
jgi:type I restriction enzyme S subunit